MDPSPVDSAIAGEAVGNPVRSPTPIRAVVSAFTVADWGAIAMWAVIAAVAIAVPARLVPNELFSRMTPTRPQDYVFGVVGAILTGLVMGLRRIGPNRDTKALGGGIGTFLAVGCPVCNKLVVALIGVGGATSVFAPIQPVIGLASLGLLGWALRTQLRALTASTCSVASV